MELTNEQRKYLGLELVDPSWERVEIPNNSCRPELSTGKIILYFDGDILRKEISADKNGRYLEEFRNLKTQDNRSMIAPITEKGKAKQLNGVNLQRCTSEGMYFRYEGGYVTLANYTTQRTYYSSAFAGLSAMSEEELQIIQFQRGRVYREIPLEGNTVIPGDFRNNGIGFALSITRNLLAACIEADSNAPYWDRGSGFHWQDLRHPQYEYELKQVLRQMGDK